MSTATTKLATVEMILTGSNYFAMRFGNVVPEVQGAVHKKYLIMLLVGNCKFFALETYSLGVILSFLTY